MSQANSDDNWLDRVEASLGRSTNWLQVIQIQESMLGTQAQQQSAINELARSQRRQDAMIERLDAILERLIHWEGRDGED